MFYSVFLYTFLFTLSLFIDSRPPASLNFFLKTFLKNKLLIDRDRDEGWGVRGVRGKLREK